MKTKNNVQKTILKSTAIAVIFGLISLTVNAQFLHTAFNKQQNHDLILALANDNTNLSYASLNISTSKDGFYANYLTTEKEENLEIENWMTNENLFDATMQIEEETESSLQLEDWMTNETNFVAASTIVEETETPMVLENWMLNDNLFSAPNMDLSVETEAELELENWMINEDVFNVEPKFETKKIISTSYFYYTEANEYSLTLEEWMVNSTTWRK